MRRAVARGAVALAAAHALLVGGCRGSETPPARHPSASSVVDPDAPFLLEGAPDERGREAPEGAAVPLDPTEFAARVAPERVPASHADAPARGPAGARVTIQVFSDFECPFCARTVPVLRAIEAQFGGAVRIVWRDFPLPMHPHARRAAAAAHEVYVERGSSAFWRMHDGLFDAQAQGLDDALIDTLARREGVDPARYAQAMAAGVHEARLDREIDTGLASGVEGTPAFFVNDWFVVGALPYEAMQALVERALADAQSARSVSRR